jgi:ATP-dependent DNA ligase
MPELMPMLLQEVEFSEDVFEKYKDYVWQEKENGVRVMVHIKDGKISAVRNRRNNPVLHLYPELTALDFGKISAILDGELVVFKNNKSVFYGGINQRDKLYSKDSVEKFPVTFVAFDMIFLNKEILLGKPHNERYELLNTGFLSYTGKHFVISDNIADPKKYWAEHVIPEGREGLVLKDPKSKYEPSQRSWSWLKLKNYKVAEVIVDSIDVNVKGNKITGKATINSEVCIVECQYGGVYNIQLGDKLPVEYLDIVGGKLIQPHKPRKWKPEVIQNASENESSKD